MLPLIRRTVSSSITARGNIVSYYKLNLLRAYAALGQPQFYSQSHVTLIKILVSEILDGPATSVKSYLHAEDSILGPWSEEIANVEELVTVRIYGNAHFLVIV
jgi:hypothetical protein